MVNTNLNLNKYSDQERDCQVVMTSLIIEHSSLRNPTGDLCVPIFLSELHNNWINLRGISSYYKRDERRGPQNIPKEE